MFKWIAKIVLRKFAAPVVDCIIQVLDQLAQNTDTTIDDAVVQQIKNYRDVIINFLLSHVDTIIKKTT